MKSLLYAMWAFRLIAFADHSIHHRISFISTKQFNGEYNSE
jgi:hypothetical protein